MKRTKMARPGDPKPSKPLPHDYQARKDTTVVTKRSLEAEYADMRTRSPGQRG